MIADREGLLVELHDSIQRYQLRALDAEKERDQLRTELDRIRALLPGARDFLAELARTSIRPMSAHAGMWRNTLTSLLPDENDNGAE